MAHFGRHILDYYSRIGRLRLYMMYYSYCRIGHCLSESRRAMAQAQSYEEWYTHAMTFYQSQNVMCGFMIIVNSSRTAPIPLVPTTSTTKSQCSRTAPIPLVPTTSTTKSQCIITIGDLLRNSCANCKRHDNQSRRRRRPRVNKRILVPTTPRRCKVKFIEPWL